MLFVSYFLLLFVSYCLYYLCHTVYEICVILFVLFVSYCLCYLCHTFLSGHTEKILFACFHPLAKDILMTASYDMTVRLWDLSRKEAEIMQLRGHQDQVGDVYCE